MTVSPHVSTRVRRQKWLLGQLCAVFFFLLVSSVELQAQYVRNITVENHTGGNVGCYGMGYLVFPPGVSRVALVSSGEGDWDYVWFYGPGWTRSVNIQEGIVLVFAQSGFIGSYSQDPKEVVWDGVKWGFILSALFAGFWSVKGIWRAFLGGDRQCD